MYFWMPDQHAAGLHTASYKNAVGLETKCEFYFLFKL